MANNAFQKNHKLMKKLGMPSFCNTKLNEEGSKFAASSSVAYTYDGFFNTPHEDKRDVSDFAYVQWIPTRSSTECNDEFDQLGFLLQLNTKTANVFENILKNEDSYPGACDGDVYYIVATAEQQIAAKNTCK
ncbi:hypothetical protein PSHT_16295 [Puccinia striiformis]|uniref:Tet-like 2OG-Fe(II) oxygenase domain-containing protein n=1 Tax=Puccinia striiformis TaxID=27350 RepID=A0A2S4UAI7_9BASI|nr:hypothetical protein PSHT_16295 [Puccinia striiformis]